LYFSEKEERIGRADSREEEVAEGSEK